MSSIWPLTHRIRRSFPTATSTKCPACSQCPWQPFLPAVTPFSAFLVACSLASLTSSKEPQQGAPTANHVTCIEEPNLVSWSERPLYPSPAQQDDRITGTNFGLCMELQDTGKFACKNGKLEQNTNSRGICAWGTRRKSQMGLHKILQEPEDLANGLMNHKLYFKLHVRKRGKVVTGRSSLFAWKMCNDLIKNHYKIYPEWSRPHD